MEKEVEKNKKEVIEIKKVEDNKDKELKKSEDTEKYNKKTKVEANTKNEKNSKKGFCVAALVLGIISLLLFCIWVISIPCAILAVIFGIIGIKSIDKGMAIAGLVTGLISLSTTFIVFMSFISLGFIFGFTEEINDNMYDKDYSYSCHDNLSE